MSFLVGSLLIWLACLISIHLRHRALVGGDFYVHFFRPYEHFWDFRAYSKRFPTLHTVKFFSADPQFGFLFEYPAPMAFLYHLGYLPPHHAVAIFGLSVGSVMLLLALLLIRKLMARRVTGAEACLVVGASLLLSYPFWFEYRFGNLEICIFFLSALGVLLFLKGRSYLSAVVFGISASLKIFPILYLGLLLSRKQYRQVAVGIATFVACNLLALLWLGPTFLEAVHGVQAGLSENRTHYMMHWLPMETGFDHSVLGFIKMLRHGFKLDVLPSSWLRAYFFLAAAGGVTLYFRRIRHLPLLNQILCLFIASVWLTPTSHDYTLIHLYVPWSLLILACAQPGFVQAGRSVLTKVFLCFAVLFSAEYGVVLRSISVGGQIKCVALAVLFYLALRYPFEFLKQQEESIGKPSLSRAVPAALGS